MTFEPTPDGWFDERATHFVEAQVLFHLKRAGVFDLLEDGTPRAAEQIAEELDLHGATLTTLLEYVHGVDSLLERDAEGNFRISAFGGQVLGRRVRDGVSGRHLDLFDVRVGSYQPIWSRLDRLLESRDPRGPAGLATTHLLPCLLRLIDELELNRIVELGVGQGLLGRSVRARPGLTAFGLDMDQQTLDAAMHAAYDLEVDGIAWLQADVFEPDAWVGTVLGAGPAALFTTCCHALVREGGAKLQAALRTLTRRLPGWYLLVLEQERLGRLLAREGYVEIFTGAGCHVERVEPLGFGDYVAFIVQL